MSQASVDHYAQSSKIDRNVAETNVVLTFALKVLSEKQNSGDPLLDSLAFKGGTCLRKVYFGTETRFSMDLDFTSLDITYPAFKERILELLGGRTYYDITFDVEEYQRPADDPKGFGANVRYSHSWRNSQFKLEVSFREKPVLPIKKKILLDELYWKYCEFYPFAVPCMQMEELIAEKIRASLERTRSRDFYDLYMYAQSAFDESKVRTLSVLKCWESGTIFDAELLSTKFREITNSEWNDLKRLVRPERMPERKEMVTLLSKRYLFLKALDNNMSLIRDDAKRHKEKDRVARLILKLNEKS